MNNFLQFYTWVVSFGIGFVYHLAIDLYFLFVNKFSISIRLLFHILYVLIVSILVIFCYFKININMMHYSYIFFWIGGYVVLNNVKIVKLWCKLARKDK